MIDDNFLFFICQRDASWETRGLSGVKVANGSRGSNEACLWSSLPPFFKQGFRHPQRRAREKAPASLALWSCAADRECLWGKGWVTNWTLWDPRDFWAFGWVLARYAQFSFSRTDCCGGALSVTPKHLLLESKITWLPEIDILSTEGQTTWLTGPFGSAVQCFIDKTPAGAVWGSTVSILGPLLGLCCFCLRCCTALRGPRPHPCAPSHIHSQQPVHTHRLEIACSASGHTTNPWPSDPYWEHFFFCAAVSLSRVRPFMPRVRGRFFAPAEGWLCVTRCAGRGDSPAKPGAWLLG